MLKCVENIQTLIRLRYRTRLMTVFMQMSHCSRWLIYQTTFQYCIFSVPFNTRITIQYCILIFIINMWIPQLKGAINCGRNNKVDSRCASCYVYSTFSIFSLICGVRKNEKGVHCYASSSSTSSSFHYYLLFCNPILYIHPFIQFLK